MKLLSLTMYTLIATIYIYAIYKLVANLKDFKLEKIKDFWFPKEEEDDY